MIFVTQYSEYLELSSYKGCSVYIDVLDDGAVYAKILFYNMGRNTHNVLICRDRYGEVIVPQCSPKGKPFPKYVKRVLDVLSELVVPSIYYKEIDFDETR